MKTAVASSIAHRDRNTTPAAPPTNRLVSMAIKACDVVIGPRGIVSPKIDGVKTFERVLTERMADAFTDDMIVLADRGFYSCDLCTTALDGGAQLLWWISGP